jgi:hypothetical protein
MITLQHPRLSAEETARLGDEIYERQIRAQVEAGNRGKIVAIDVETDAYALAETALAASCLLQAQHLATEVWFVRVGHRALYKIGACSLLLQAFSQGFSPVNLPSRILERLLNERGCRDGAQRH